ncbi:MAG: GntR family transcriptional regulator [Chloroflexota bacterium]
MVLSIPDLTASRALHADVEAYVVDLIRNGSLRPGDRVNEAEIARRLRISRSPVREAFTRLTKDGVLDHSPRRGVFVAQPSVESLEEIAGLRAVIEGFAARQAAAHIQTQDIERLRRIVEEGAAAGRRGDWLAMEERNAEFHDVLVGCARHQLLTRVWKLLIPMTWKLVPGLRPGVIDAAAVENFLDRHRELIDVLAVGDPNQAERTAINYVTKAAAHMLAGDRRGLAPVPEGEAR